MGTEATIISVRARKSHRCSQCGSSIEPGGNYFRATLKRTGPIYCTYCNPTTVKKRKGVLTGYITKLLIEENQLHIYDIYFLPTLVTGTILYVFGFSILPSGVFNGFWLSPFQLLGPEVNPDIVLFKIGLFFFVIPIFVNLILLSYKNRVIQWIIDLEKGVIVLQQTAPHFKELKTIRLEDVKEIIHLRVRTYWYKGDEISYLKFRLRRNKFLRFWSEHSTIKSFYDEKIQYAGCNIHLILGGLISDWLHIPFSDQVSNMRLHIIFGLPMTVFGILVSLIFFDHQNWIYYLTFSTLIALVTLEIYIRYLHPHW